MIHRISLLALLLLMFTGHALRAQKLTFPINIHTGENIETCTGAFTHSGADTLTPYQNNENYKLTFSAPQDQGEELYLNVFFRFFELGAGDVLSVYDGEDETAPLLFEATGTSLKGKQIWSSGTSLHFQFVSSASDPARGWWGEISCFSLCDAFTATVTSETGSFDFCPEVQNITFFASSTYLGGNWQGSDNDRVYQWNFDGTIKFGKEVNHSYPGPGAYPFRLTVTDNANGCETDTIVTLRLATFPDFTGTRPSADTVCAREPFSLFGVINTTIWTGFPTQVDTIAFINPDNPFVSVLEFDVFPEEFSIQNGNDIDRICVEIEHVNHGHVSFSIECPSGSSIFLKDFSQGGAHLGEPVVFNDALPGIGYAYCFTPTPAYGKLNETAFRYHDYTDLEGTLYFNQPYLPAGDYTPQQSLNFLAGCPLNGPWTLRVTDNTSNTSGHITGWSLFFEESFYPDSLIFQPQIVQEQWYDHQGNTLSGNPANTTLQEAGEYTFKFEATDNFGCRWDTLVQVVVLPLPKAEISSDPELPLCEGDSAVFRISPVNAGDQLHWVYQWMMEGASLEGRTYDTLWVKDPMTYMALVMDTLTGCQDFFTLALSTRNCDLRIPNVFTPNGDQINDFFEIENLENYPGSVMVIYNRHGKKVFENSDYYGNWWDGGNQPEGTYYYVLTYVRQGIRKQVHGAITIVR